MDRIGGTIVSMILVPLVLLLAGGARGNEAHPGESAKKKADPTLTDALALQRGMERTISRVRPAVVTIDVTGRPNRNGQIARGGGSGIIVSPKGYVLTNDHVVGWAASISVTLSGFRKVPAKVVGLDPEGDLALIALQGKGPWPTIRFGDSDAVHPGQWVLAMGNPRGMAVDGRATVTWGIVTAVHCIGGGQNLRLFYGDAIQTDAEINPGNSGGPLFDLQGRLLGINGRIATRDRIANGAVNANVGFSIPVNEIRRFLPLLEAGKTIHHGYLGVRVLERASKGGVVVAFVMPGSPASAAGLRAGDVISSLDGRVVDSPIRLTNLTTTRPAGDRVPIRVSRDGRERVVFATLGRRPENVE